MRKVWTYLSSKPLSDQDVDNIKADALAFVAGWTAHDIKLAAEFELHRNRILVVSVDEDVHNASGCSIDKLLRFIKDTEKKYSIELLNRLLVALDTEQGIEVIKSSEVPGRLQNGSLSAQSLVYNTSVATEQEFKEWLQPLSATWLSKYLDN